jgi:hypothetical protein
MLWTEAKQQAARDLNLTVAPSDSIGLQNLYNAGGEFKKKTDYIYGIKRKQPPKQHSVKTVICFIKGNAIFGNVPDHKYILVDGVGYGKYANSHAGGPPDSSGGLGVVATAGTVRSGDESLYPVVADPSKLADGTPYGVASDPPYPVNGDLLLANIQEVLGRRDLFYGVGSADCYTWVQEMLNASNDESKVSNVDVIFGQYNGAHDAPH